MLTVDGREGGGQLLRTALSLSVVTDTAFEIEGIRGSRPEPGLKPQHLAAVETLAEFCDAAVEGAAPGAASLTFEPGDRRRTALAREMDTAASVTLLFDTLLPVAAVADEPLGLAAAGGTDVKWSPTVAHHRRVKLPLLSRWGLDAAVDLARTGFYPAGGGRATLSVEPWSPVAAELVTRGDLDRVEVYSTASETLAAAAVADRQADHAVEELEAAGLPATVERAAYVETRSPGSSLLLRGVYDETLVGVDALGERGRPSEAVAEGAVERFLSVHRTGAPVDDHVADQVMVVLALAGGRVRIPRVTDHVETNLALLRAFDCEVSLDRDGEGAVLTAVSHPALD